MYAVIEADAAVVPRQKGEEDSNDTAELELVLEDDLCFVAVSADRRLRAFACYDTDKEAEDRRCLHLALVDIEKRLGPIGPWNNLWQGHCHEYDRVEWLQQYCHLSRQHSKRLQNHDYREYDCQGQ